MLVFAVSLACELAGYAPTAPPPDGVPAGVIALSAAFSALLGASVAVARLGPAKVGLASEVRGRLSSALSTSLLLVSEPGSKLANLADVLFLGGLEQAIDDAAFTLLAASGQRLQPAKQLAGASVLSDSLVRRVLDEE